MGSTSGVTNVFMLTLRSQIFEHLGETLYRRALEYLELGRSETKMKRLILFLRIGRTVVDVFEGPSLVKKHFYC